MARGKRGGAIESADTLAADVAGADTLAAESTGSSASRDPDGYREEQPLAAGARVGRYVVIGPLGRGGMGMVYKAFDPELDRAVALKVVSLRRDTGDLSSSGERARLAREAQAIAKVSHPNVVAVHDVGVEGRTVFVAMEYIDGVTLREWTAHRRRTWREIVTTFVQAGRGLAAAHAAGLVHRDFKPENVIVSRDGRARVLDFGLARAASDVALPVTPRPSTVELEPDQTGPLSTPLTREGAIMGTPGYMAPEQYTGGVTDAKSDQFSFCVALYEALYGHKPFAGKKLSELKSEVLGGRVVDEPRGTGVPRRVRELLLRGLTVDRDRRHRSVTALLDRLTRTTVASTRLRVAVAATLGLAAVGTTALVAGSAREPAASPCQGGARKLAGIWDQDVRAAVGERLAVIGGARGDALRARVLNDLDVYSRSWLREHRAACEATRVHGEQSEHALDLRMLCLDRQLGEVRALTTVLAQGDEAVAERAAVATGHLPELADCADLRSLSEIAAPPADEAARRRLTELEAKLDRAKVLTDAGKVSDARELLDAAVPEARDLGHEPAIALAYFHRAAVARMEGDGAASREALLEALVRAERAGDDVLRARAAADLVFVVGYLEDRPEDGLTYARMAEAVLDRLGGRDSIRATVLSNTGAIYLVQQRYADAVETTEQAVELREAVFGKDSYDLISSLNNLGSALNELGRNQEAVRHLEHAARIIETLFGPDHPHRAAVLVNLGLALHDLGRSNEAVEAYREALRVYEQVLGPEHRMLAAPLSNLADAVADLGQLDEARSLYERSLAIRRAANGDDHPSVALGLLGYGRSLRQAGDLDGSAAAIKRALEIWRGAHGAEHADIARALHALAQTRRGQHRYHEAGRLLAQARTMYEKVLGAEHPTLVPVLTDQGELALETGAPADALAPLERALVVAEAGGGPPQHRADAEFALARALWQAGGDRERALELAAGARATYAAMGGGAEAQRTTVEAWLVERDGQ